MDTWVVTAPRRDIGDFLDVRRPYSGPRPYNLTYGICCAVWIGTFFGTRVLPPGRLAWLIWGR